MIAPCRCLKCDGKTLRSREQPRNKRAQKTAGREGAHMFKYSSGSKPAAHVCVTPKRLLAERVLRRVEARNSVEVAPEFVASPVSASRVLRLVEVRCVLASQSGLPRLFASGLEGPRSVLVGMFRTLKRTARATLFERMAERFASLSVASVASGSSACCVPVCCVPVCCVPVCCVRCVQVQSCLASPLSALRRVCVGRVALF